MLTHSFPTRRSSDLTISAIGVEPTLRRGFALVTRPDGSVVRSAGSLRSGDLVAVLLADRSEEHTSELQSLMRISYAVFCLKKKNNKLTYTTHTSSYRITRHTTQLKYIYE